jgi:competence protein ComEA
MLSFIGQAWAEVNVNTASLSELTALKGVGPATAEKIVLYREANGAFTSCADLINVKGIGVKKIESIKPDCTIGDAKGNKTKEVIKESKSKAKGLDINSASAKDLTALKGVGKKTAGKHCFL